MTNTTQPNLETHFTGAQDQTTAEIVQGTWVDLAGFTRAKNVPARRKESFARNGLGAAKVWIVYGADNTFAENDEFSVSGDLRLHLDTSALRQLDSHVVWGPTNLTNQDGSPSEYDPRTRIRTAAYRDRGPAQPRHLRHAVGWIRRHDLHQQRRVLRRTGARH